MSNFRQFDRATGFLLAPSLDEWLPERHLARFVVEVIDGLDLSAMVKSYRGSGSAGGSRSDFAIFHTQLQPDRDPRPFWGSGGGPVTLPLSLRLCRSE
jgi:hypothetical protein